MARLLTTEDRRLEDRRPVRVVYLDENIGGEAFNVVIPLTRGDFIHLSENDQIFLPGWAEHAREAIRRAGLEPRSQPIRGGTDGSRLSFMGLPTPNLFAGEHNFHSRLEWVSVQDMEKAVEVIVHLCRVWEEQTLA